MRDDRNRFLSDQVAISRLGISRRTFYRYLKEGVIEPPPAKVGKNRRGWTDGDIQLAADQMRNKETVP